MQSLPPADHGRQAYLVLAGCTLIQAPVWGYSISYGVFQKYYTTHKGIEGSPGAVAIVGTTLNGLMYLMMPLTFTLLTKYPRLRPYTGPVGLCITIASLVMSSYATQVWQLIASQGVLCAIGSGLLFSPTTLYLDEWWVARKGLAYGTMWAGKAASGVVVPFIMSALLDRFGPRTTLQAWAVALIVLTAPLLFYLKPRIPLSNSHTQRPLSWTFLKNPGFWMLQIGNVVQAFGYLLPTTYLASYANDLGLPSFSGALLLAVFSIASVPGSLFIGYLGDRFHPTTVILICSLGSTVAVLLFWGLAAEMALLLVFAVVYGFFAGGFSTTYSGILKEMKRTDEGVETGLVMGLLLGGRGVGFMAAGPASAALLQGGSRMIEHAKWGYSTQYGPMIILTGATALLGSLGWMWTILKAVLV
ncbi:MFS general substrate transporter [Hyaloscypha variabilis]